MTPWIAFSTILTNIQDSVKDLKISLEQKTGIPWTAQRLIFKGKVLKDDATLASCGMISYKRPKKKKKIQYCAPTWNEC